MSANGRTAIDFSEIAETGVVAGVTGAAGLCAASCFDNQNLPVSSSAKPTITKASATVIARLPERGGALLGDSDALGSGEVRTPATFKPTASRVVLSASWPRTDSTSDGRLCTTGKRDASSHCFAVRKYSRTGGNSAASTRTLSTRRPSAL